MSTGNKNPITLEVPLPKRTVYIDIVDLPDPVKLSLTVRYFNHDDITLYFQITGSAPGWTIGTVNLGSLASGANAYGVLTEFASRAKPTAETEEDITLTLNAYTDSGFTNLKWTTTRTLHIVFIKSDDPSYTLDILNNFDDGTAQGWSALAVLNCSSGQPVLQTARTDYVLSPPYSIRLSNTKNEGTWYGIVQGALQKSITTPNKDIIYAICDLRLSQAHSGANPRTHYLKQLIIRYDTYDLLNFGIADSVAQHYLPVDKWIRAVIPLPKNVAITLKIIIGFYAQVVTSGDYAICYAWTDNFKVISK
jgi:hypothetical protein